MNSDSNPVALARKETPGTRARTIEGQSRWLRWSLVDRYILSELIGPFLFGIAAFTSIMVAGQFLFKLTSWLAKGAPVPEVLALFGLRLLPMIVITFPMAALLATLLAYGRLSGDMETTAMAAGGIPFLRMAAPAFLLGLVISLAGLAVNELIVPRAGRTSRQLEAAIARALAAKGLDAAFVSPGKAAVIQDFEDGELARVVVAQRFELAEKKLHGVIWLQYGEGDPRPVTGIIQAESAVWENDRWFFNKAFFQPLKDTGASGSAGGRRFTGAFDRVEMTLNKSPDQVLSSQKKPEDMSYRELQSYLQALREQSVPKKSLLELEIDLHNKLAIPFATLVFTLIGTPLALRRLRGGASVGLGLSVLIIFGYYVIWHGMSIMAEGGHVPPLWASWTANLLGLAAGGGLIARAAS